MCQDEMRISMKGKTKGVLIALAAIVCVLIWVLVRRPPPIPRVGESEASTVDRAKDLKVDDGLAGEHAPEGRRSLGDRPSVDRRQAFELGKRVFLPRPSVASGTLNSTAMTHHPRALMPGGDGLVDRRPDGGTDWPNLKAELEKRIHEVRTSTAHCLDGWAKEDPSLATGVVLALSVDEQGLADVWIKDRAEAPSGPLSCLSNSVYPIDWGGLTKDKMLLTVRVQYEPTDAGQLSEVGGAPSPP
jgi:hypothetical protein